MMTRAENEAFARKYAKWAAREARVASDTSDTPSWVSASARCAEEHAADCEEYMRRAEGS